MSLQDQFVAFSKFGDTKSTGATITLTQSDKWMKQAKIIDGRRVTTTDTGVCFNKFKSSTISFNDWLKYVDIFCEYKDINAEDLKQKLIDCGLPGTQNAEKDANTGGTGGTDVSKFSSKQKLM